MNRTNSSIALFLVGCLIQAGCATRGTSESPASAPEIVFPPPPEEPRFYFERSILGSSDIIETTGRNRWRELLTGETRRSTGFAKPFDVEACQGRIFVSDTVRRSVLMFNVPDGSFDEVGTGESADLLKPLGMAVDGDCNLFVVDATSRRVVVFDQDGDYVKAIGGEEWFQRPTHVEVDPDGTRLFVVETGGVGSNQHGVRVFDVASGQHLYDIGTRGDGPGEFNLPRDIAMGVGGRLYVVDGGNFRVQVFESDGQFVGSFGSIGVQNGQFARPKGIASDIKGNVYITDASFGNFQIFDPDGQLLLFIGHRSETPEPAGYMLPAGIAVDEDGRVYMVDQFFRKVDVFRPAGIATDQGYLGARVEKRPER